jgi:osmotically-inducible protein OsmY
MKSDVQIQRDVVDELHWEPITRQLELGVACKDSVVTITGNVSSYIQKNAAVKAAERVLGVRAVADDVRVQIGRDGLKSDTELAHAAANALRWDALVPTDKVKARVDGGWVSLDGEVEWEYQRRAAVRVVSNLEGVKGVTNLITLRPVISTTEVAAKIKAALRRAAETEADAITVDAVDGRITLRGKVRTSADRRDAERAAWSAPGVREVVDQLTVSA